MMHFVGLISGAFVCFDGEVIGSHETDLGRMQLESEKETREHSQDIWPAPQCGGASEQQAQTHACVVSWNQGSLAKAETREENPASLQSNTAEAAALLFSSPVSILIVLAHCCTQCSQTVNAPHWSPARYR